jgi:hypothetical protein
LRQRSFRRANNSFLQSIGFFEGSYEALLHEIKRLELIRAVSVGLNDEVGALLAGMVPIPLG